MSINACTINNTTIDAICGNRRAAIIATLISALPDAALKGHVQVNPGTFNQPRRYFRQTIDDYDEIQQTEFEQPNINVSIEFNGNIYSQTISQEDNSIPLIVVSQIQIVDDIKSVNISNVKFRIID